MENEKYREYSRYAAHEERMRSIEKRKEDNERSQKRIRIIIAAAAVLAVVLVLYLAVLAPRIGSSTPDSSAGGATQDGKSEVQQPVDEVIAEAVTEEVTEAETDPPFEPHSVESTYPGNLIAYTEIEDNGEPITADQYQPWYDMNFGAGEAYTDVDGIVTFRGDNFRNAPQIGTAELYENTINGIWSIPTSSTEYNGSLWSGSGWTGQPLMQRWSRETKKAMNMYDWAKEKDDLVEVIYACMDGYIYFMDLITGEATRDPMYLGWTFKGAGALDPRGYPIMYLGAGYDSNEGTSRAFIINLLDCSVMYTFGDNDSFSLRGALSYFDSSALVDGESDTLIYPGENGILYLIHLGTQYDPAAGTLSINPDRFVKWHYYGVRSSTQSYWVGMEDSAAIYKNYLFVADNGGNLMCLDLNTLRLVWVQDTLDDTNCSPVLSMEDGHLYVYISTSFRLGWRSETTATIPIWKIDAETGEVVWHTDYECYTQDGVSGGVQSTIAVGKQQLDDRIFVTVGMTGSAYSGVLACLDKATGEIRWEHNATYAWSSPVCVYRPDGSGDVLYADCSGQMYLLDPADGRVLSTFTLSDGTIEASPAVYGNRVVVGTRSCTIQGLELR